MTRSAVVPPGTIELDAEFWRRTLVSTEHLSPETEQYAAGLVASVLPHLEESQRHLGHSLWARLNEWAYGYSAVEGLTRDARAVLEAHEGTLLGAVAEACLLKITQATTSMADLLGSSEILPVVLELVYENPRGLRSNTFAVEHILAGYDPQRSLQAARAYRQALGGRYEVTDSFVKALDWFVEHPETAQYPPTSIALEQAYKNRFSPETEEVFYRLIAEGMMVGRAADVAPALS